MEPTIRITVTGPREAASAICNAIHAFSGKQDLPEARTLAGLLGSHEINTDFEATESPQPPVVPLGKNRTRDGREAIVHSKDSPVPGFPLVVSVKDAEGGTWTCCFYPESGAYGKGPHPFDLVGHLPPEPKELWIAPHPLEGWPQVSEFNRGEGYVLFREVLP